MKAGTKAPVSRKSRAGTSIKRINIDKLYRQLLNVMHRETRQLLRLSYAGKLPKEEASALCSYLRLVRELRRSDEDDLEDLTDEELEQIEAGGRA